MANRIKRAAVNTKTTVKRVKAHVVKGSKPFGRQPKNV